MSRGLLRVATSDRLVFGKGKLWQHSLSLIAPRDSAWAKQIGSKRLPPGRYWVKIYVDSAGRLQRDRNARLEDDPPVAELEVESMWPAGYGRMTVAAFPE